MGFTLITYTHLQVYWTQLKAWKCYFTVGAYTNKNKHNLLSLGIYASPLSQKYWLFIRLTGYGTSAIMG